MKTDLFQSCGHCWVYQTCWHIECSTFTASSFSIWNSWAGIPSHPLALFVVIFPKAHLTSHSRMSGSRLVNTPSWLSGSWRCFLYSSSVYSCHLFLISSASLRSIPFLPLIVPIFAWNVPLVSLTFLQRSLVFPTLLFSSISLHWLLVHWSLSNAGVKGILLGGVSCEEGVASYLSSSFDCPQHSVLHIIQTQWVLPGKCMNTWSVLVWLPVVALSHTSTQSSARPGRKVLVVDAEHSSRFPKTWGSRLLSEGSLSQLPINAPYDNFLKQVVILSRLVSEIKKQWVESPFIPLLWSQVLLTRWNIITRDWANFSWKQRKYVYLRLWMKNTVKKLEMFRNYLQLARSLFCWGGPTGLYIRSHVFPAQMLCGISIMWAF